MDKMKILVLLSFTAVKTLSRATRTGQIVKVKILTMEKLKKKKTLDEINVL